MADIVVTAGDSGRRPKVNQQPVLRAWRTLVETRITFLHEGLEPAPMSFRDGYGQRITDGFHNFSLDYTGSTPHLLLVRGRETRRQTPI